LLALVVMLGVGTTFSFSKTLSRLRFLSDNSSAAFLTLRASSLTLSSFSFFFTASFSCS